MAILTPSEKLVYMVGERVSWCDDWGTVREANLAECGQWVYEVRLDSPRSIDVMALYTDLKSGPPTAQDMPNSIKSLTARVEALEREV